MKEGLLKPKWIMLDVVYYEEDLCSIGFDGYTD
jgi:hypothetical protein